MDGCGEHLHNSNMSMLQPDARARRVATAAAAPAAPLPTYALYGEPGRTEAMEWLHCESIAERSQQHDWQIRPHRHAALLQILHIAHGTATARLDGGPQPLVGPCLLLLPALVPHGFGFAPDIQGTVITVLEAHLARLLQGAAPLAARLLLPVPRWLPLWRAADLAGGAGAGAVADVADAAAVVADAVARLCAEFYRQGAWRDLALDAALLHLAVVLGRLVPADAAPASAPLAPDRALGHVRRYRALVEARFRQQPTLAVLAAVLGITPTQLNRVCHRVLGHSALGVLHGRLLLEAQRELAFTTLAVKQIGLGLGFADAGYFSRFFQRLTGRTPTAWRAQSGGAAI